MPDGSYWRSGECKQMYNGVINNFYRNCEDINEYTPTPPINSVPDVPNIKITGTLFHITVTLATWDCSIIKVLVIMVRLTASLS